MKTIKKIKISIWALQKKKDLSLFSRQTWNEMKWKRTFVTIFYHRFQYLFQLSIFFLLLRFQSSRINESRQFVTPPPPRVFAMPLNPTQDITGFWPAWLAAWLQAPAGAPFLMPKVYSDGINKDDLGRKLIHHKLPFLVPKVYSDVIKKDDFCENLKSINCCSSWLKNSDVINIDDLWIKLNNIKVSCLMPKIYSDFINKDDFFGEIKII